MNNWKNNSLLDVITIENTKECAYPIVCPICKKPECHLYCHLYNKARRHGGLWVWCSNCRNYEHFQYIVPPFWKNCPKIDFLKLCASPDYLEENKTILDEHINHILKDKHGTGDGSPSHEENSN